MRTSSPSGADPLRSLPAQLLGPALPKGLYLPAQHLGPALPKRVFNKHCLFTCSIIGPTPLKKGLIYLPSPPIGPALPKGLYLPAQHLGPALPKRVFNKHCLFTCSIIGPTPLKKGLIYLPSPPIGPALPKGLYLPAQHLGQALPKKGVY